MSIEAKFLHFQAIQNGLAPFRYLYCVDHEATCDEVGDLESSRLLAVVPNGHSMSLIAFAPWRDTGAADGK